MIHGPRHNLRFLWFNWLHNDIGNSLQVKMNFLVYRLRYCLVFYYSCYDLCSCSTVLRVSSRSYTQSTLVPPEGPSSEKNWSQNFHFILNRFISSGLPSVFLVVRSIRYELSLSWTELGLTCIYSRLLFLYSDFSSGSTSTCGSVDRTNFLNLKWNFWFQ